VENIPANESNSTNKIFFIAFFLLFSGKTITVLCNWKIKHDQYKKEGDEGRFSEMNKMRVQSENEL
jgi:hypothetical protein